MKFRTLLTTASAVALSFGLAAGAQADDNKLFVEQVGNKNFEGSAQMGSNNETFVSQQGDANSAGASATEQGVGNANNNRILVDQNGNANVGAISFVSGGNRFDQNTVGIVQDTNRNYTNLNLTQDRAGTNGLFDSTIFVEQGGGNENFVGGEEAVSGFSAGNGQFATAISNAGVSNASLEGSNGTGDVGFGLIRGEQQFFGLVQNGASNAFAVSMDGQGNQIGGAGGNSAGPRNLNDRTNTGDFFSGDTTIAAPGGSGAFGVANLAQQNGNHNVGVVSTSGINNAVAFSQNGNRNVAEVYQQGNNNNASAVQQ